MLNTIVYWEPGVGFWTLTVSWLMYNNLLGGWASDHYIPIDMLRFIILLVKTNWTQGKKTPRYKDNGSLIHSSYTQPLKKNTYIYIYDSLIC